MKELKKYKCYSLDFKAEGSSKIVKKLTVIIDYKIIQKVAIIPFTIRCAYEKKAFEFKNSIGV